MKVLVVDRDDVFRHVVRDLLGTVCELYFVSDVEHALQLTRDPELDLIVLDLEQSDRFECSDVPVIAVHDRDYKSTIEPALAVLRAERRHRARRVEELSARISHLEKSNGDLERIACVDPLTGIANRQHLDNLLAIEWARATRDGSSLSLVMLDLDYFHALNERYGHLGGDDCLKRVAGAMARCLRRPSDILARFGGEEFVALLPTTSLAGACLVAERLRARVEQLQRPHETSRCGSVVTISAGVATATPSQDRGPETLLAAADVALFRAKEHGRNRFCASAPLPATALVAQPPWPTCPVVTAAPFLARRIPRFIESCRAEIAAAREDSRLASALGRELETTGVSFGFDQLIDLGGRLDGAAGRDDRDAIAHALEELSWYLDHVQVVYQAAAPKRINEEMTPARA